jgi:hypothetical protein
MALFGKPSSTFAALARRSLIGAVLLPLFICLSVAQANAIPLQSLTGLGASAGPSDVGTSAVCTIRPPNRNYNCSGTNNSVGCAVHMYRVSDSSRYADTDITWSGSIYIAGYLNGSGTRHTVKGPSGNTLFTQFIGNNRSESYSWNPPARGTTVWIQVRDAASPSTIISEQRCRVA